MYGFSINLNESFEAAITRVTQALKEQGFGILTQIDVKETLKVKIDVDHLPYTILGACNPQLAQQALEVGPSATWSVLQSERQGCAFGVWHGPISDHVVCGAVAPLVGCVAGH